MNFKGLPVIVMMLGSAALAGCNRAPSAPDQASEASSDAASNDGAAAETTSWYSWRSWGWGHSYVARPVAHTYWSNSYARFAPPAARYEVVGRAPSARHFWMPGYYSWGSGRYAWNGGHWDLRRPGFTYVPGHWDNVGGYWHYVPGAFRRV